MTWGGAVDLNYI